MKTLRIDLTDYTVYMETLKDKLNEEALYLMSLTEAVKIAMICRANRKAVENLLHDVEIKRHGRSTSD